MSQSYFHFNEKQKKVFDVNEKILLHLEPYSSSISLLYFTDNLKNKIVIPENINVFTYEFQREKMKIHKRRIPLEKMDPSIYSLCYTDDYEVEVDGKLFLTIKNQRSWLITNHSIQS